MAKACFRPESGCPSGLLFSHEVSRGDRHHARLRRGSALLCPASMAATRAAVPIITERPSSSVTTVALASVAVARLHRPTALATALLLMAAVGGQSHQLPRGTGAVRRADAVAVGEEPPPPRFLDGAWRIGAPCVRLPLLPRRADGRTAAAVLAAAAAGNQRQWQHDARPAPVV